MTSALWEIAHIGHQCRCIEVGLCICADEDKDTNHPNGKNGNPVGDNEPNPPIANQVMNATDGNKAPGGNQFTKATCDESNRSPQVLGDAKDGNLLLAVSQLALNQ